MSQTLTVNGREFELDVPAFYPLAVVLREELGLIGTKAGCFEGRCGACTVIVEDRTVVSCIYPVGLCDGKTVRTVESLPGADDELNGLQRALVAAGGVQCGVCTPGMLMTLTSLLEESPSPTEAEVREALAGNLCRCTGYARIVEAAMSMAATSS
ncbi:MAG: (2Fe-2S)-binding protein [Gaiellales bacterium]